MYRGVGPPLAGVTPIFALSFWVSPSLFPTPARPALNKSSQSYDLGKKIVYSLTPNRTSTQLTTSELAFAGFFSAVPTTLVAAPVERIKVVLQVQGQGQQGGTMYKGPVDAMKGLYREGGLRGIFRGTLATLARDGPGSAA